MRHFMVDPDNEERLLKVPPHVVEKIKAEAFTEGYTHGRKDAAAAVEALGGRPSLSIDPIDCNYSCNDGPCTCSGEFRVQAWDLNPTKAVAAALGENDEE